MSDDDREPGIEDRIRALEHVIRIFGVVAISTVGSLAQHGAVSTQRYRQVLKDMLGSEEMLPGLTKILFSASEFRIAYLFVPLLVIGVGIVGALKLPQTSAIIAFGVALLLLASFWVLTRIAFSHPLLQAIQGVSAV